MCIYRVVAVALLGFCSIAWAEEPGVIHVDALKAAQAEARNTYSNDNAGVSVTAPEGWSLYADDKVPFGPMVNDDAQYPLIGIVTATPFPLESDWVLFMPRVILEVHDVRTTEKSSGPTPTIENREQMELARKNVEGLIMSSALQAAQSDRSLRARVVLPPGPAHAGENNVWIKSGIAVTLPLSGPTVAAASSLEGYQEILMRFAIPVDLDWQHANDLSSLVARLYIVQFIARAEDVPTYRKAVDAMVQSIKLLPFTTGDSKTAASRAEL